jgi:hypothetical protein
MLSIWMLSGHWVHVKFELVFYLMWNLDADVILSEILTR